MIKPFTEQERAASKNREQVNRPWAFHWRTRCQSDAEVENTTGVVEDHSKQELKQKA